VAHQHQPLRRGDDDLRGHVRRHLPGDPRRSRLVVYWLFPIPNQMAMWPNFRSPLLWDVFAVSTYATVSMLFWYVGMIPDLATLRDRAKSKIKRQIALRHLRLGWTGSNRHWHRYERAYLLLAALATPLVLRCTRSLASTSRSRSCPAGTRRSSRPTSSPARSSAASRWW
jgi:hypothetical protein